MDVKGAEYTNYIKKNCFSVRFFNIRDYFMSGFGGTESHDGSIYRSMHSMWV